MNESTLSKENYSVCKDFQDQVSKVLIRHRSILDVITKLDEYNARINRAVAKSVTSCGCISINAKKQDYDTNTFEDMLGTVQTHLDGDICNSCKEVVEEEIGSYIFYLAALSDTLGLSLDHIISEENDRVKTLGVFSLK